MKSSRQKKIEKHANTVKRTKRTRFIVLVISSIVISVPVFLTYYYR
ncbi:MAG TPA: hypothetical protein VIN07_12890 [Flavipsychrobacter sp.]